MPIKELGPCTLWSGYVGSNGYGQLNRGGKVHNAHAYSYEKAKGPVPTGLVLDHLCRNPACINPEHLEPVTQAINVQRGLRAKLTPAQVIEIRRRYVKYENSNELAEEFNITRRQITHITARKTWKNLPQNNTEMPNAKS